MPQKGDMSGIDIQRHIVRLGTLEELFAFNDWARDTLMECARGLSDEALDRPFEMGEGSLRKTLNHLYAAERVWLDRWERKPNPQYRPSAVGVTMPRLWDEFREVAARRAAYLAGVKDADLGVDLTYTNIRGQTYTFPLGAMMLHVSNHGSHHRAQAVNMLRRVGGPLPKPGADYIFMKLAQPDATPCQLDVDTLRTYFAQADWAQAAVMKAAEPLGDTELDRPFEIGQGTLRETLSHICDAEQWWYSNWTTGPGALFPSERSRASVRSIAERYTAASEVRNAFLASKTDRDLTARVEATPRPGMIRNFPLGVTLLQLCHHGAHHRAQALNMLRHVGAVVPAVDVLEMFKS